MPEQPQSRRHQPSVTAVELADIAGVKANTVRVIARELFEMLERDMEQIGFELGKMAKAR